MFWSNQSNTEKVLICYGIVMLLNIMVIVGAKVLNPRMVVKKKAIFEGISTLITGIFIVISFAVKDMTTPNLPYQLAMIVALFIVNTVLISNFRITKLFNVELGETTADNYQKLADYVETADELTVMTTEFISELNRYDKQSTWTYEEILNSWLISITPFIDKRHVINIRILDAKANSLENFLTNLVFEKKLWYNEGEIKHMVKEINDKRIIHLTPNIKIISPKEVFYIESEKELSEIDTGFLFNTYLIAMSIFANEEEEI